MGTAVRPPDRLPTDPAADEDQYRLAVEEARAQAEALRHAVSRANMLVQQLEEMVEGLRAILMYPKAYDWPPLEGTTEQDISGTEDITVLADPHDAELGRS
jgi:hypothetical protein